MQYWQCFLIKKEEGQGIRGFDKGPNTGTHLGKLLGKGKVTAMGFINNQWDVMLMAQCGQACMTDHTCSKASQRSQGKLKKLYDKSRPPYGQTCDVAAGSVVAGGDNQHSADSQLHGRGFGESCLQRLS